MDKAIIQALILDTCSALQSIAENVSQAIKDDISSGKDDDSVGEDAEE